LTKHFGNQIPETIIEPGRGMVGNAGLIEAEVVLVSKKSADADEVRWVYLDIGKFGGLAETMDESIRYPIRTTRDGDRTEPCVIAGLSTEATAMNDPILAGYVFNPSARTIDFSAVPGFSFSRLFGIEHKPSGQFLYLAATPELTPTINGAVLTLDPTIDLTGMAANDPLSFRYDPLPGIQTGDANGALAVGGVAAPVAANPARKFIEITNTGRRGETAPEPGTSRRANW
jgi:hypothetical protein